VGTSAATPDRRTRPSSRARRRSSKGDELGGGDRLRELVGDRGELVGVGEAAGQADATSALRVGAVLETPAVVGELRAHSGEVGERVGAGLPHLAEQLRVRADGHGELPAAVAVDDHLEDQVGPAAGAQQHDEQQQHPRDAGCPVGARTAVRCSSSLGPGALSPPGSVPNRRKGTGEGAPGPVPTGTARRPAVDARPTQKVTSCPSAHPGSAGSGRCSSPPASSPTPS
jgi:hypothetical protein